MDNIASSPDIPQHSSRIPFEEGPIDPQLLRYIDPQLLAYVAALISRDYSKDRILRGARRATRIWEREWELELDLNHAGTS